MPASKNRQFALMMTAVSLCYLSMVMPLSVLSIYVTRDLGMSNFRGGLAAGAAFFMTMLFRKRGGDVCDRLGGKSTYLRGGLLFAAGSAVCLLAALPALPPLARFALLLAGRLIVGLGESFGNIGMVCWSLDVVGVHRAGYTFATIGMSMYASAAVGGQLGFYLFDNYGFAGLNAVGALGPVLGVLLARSLPEQKPDAPPCPVPAAANASLADIMRRIWRIGLPSVFHGAGYAVVAAFLSKTFLDRGWDYAGLGFTFCGIGFVVMRLLIGNLPDRIGGFPVAFISGLVEMAGLYLLWLAPGPALALLGSFLTGAGCSMIFPSLSLEIIKTMPSHLRGASVSCYNIFIDVAYGFAGPVAGLFADRYGNASAYLFAALAATAGLGMIAASWRKRART